MRTGKNSMSVASTGKRITVAVSGEVRLFATNGADPACMSGSGYDIAATCPTTNARFQRLISGDGGLAVRVATGNGRAYEIAELHLP